jgi:hypothetical protein
MAHGLFSVGIISALTVGVEAYKTQGYYVERLPVTVMERINS